MRAPRCGHSRFPFLPIQFSTTETKTRALRSAVEISASPSNKGASSIVCSIIHRLKDLSRPYLSWASMASVKVERSTAPGIRVFPVINPGVP